MAINKKLLDKFNIWLFVLLVAGNLFAINYMISDWHKARIDLTQYKEHSLSAYSKKVLHTLPDRVEIVALFSTDTHKLLKPLIPKIRDILEDYVSESDGRVVVQFSSPSSDKAVEHIFEEYGIKPMPVPLKTKYKEEVKSIYFNMIIKYGDQHIKYALQEMVNISEEGNQLHIALKDMESLLTRGIKKAIHSFATIDSALANISGEVEVIYHKLPKALLKNIPPEKIKDLETAEKKLRSKVKKFTTKFKNKVKFQEKEATDENHYFLITVGYGKKIVAFRLFTNLQEVSKANVADNLEASMKRILPGFAKSIGVVFPPPLAQPPRMGQRQRPMPSEFAHLQGLLSEESDVKRVNLKSGVPPVDVEALLVFRPENLGSKELYAIDQYIMLGGRVAFFLDSSKLNLQSVQMGKFMLDSVKSGLEEMMAKWGVVIEDSVLQDQKHIPYPMPRELQPGLVVMEDIPYHYFVKIESPTGHPIVDNIPELGFLWPGALTTRTPAKGLKIKTLISSSSKSWLTKLNSTSGLDVTPKKDPSKAASPVATSSNIIAVAITGKFESFFKAKQPPGVDSSSEKPAKDDKKDKKGKEDKTKSKKDKVRTSKVNISPDTKVIIVSDSDFISEIGAKILEQRFSFSFKLLTNMVEWLQSDDEDFQTSAKGLPRPLKELSNSKKAKIQHVTWIVSLGLLALLFMGLYFLRRRLVR
jgi:gliding motility-associated transport system permease protein/gliding motility-associatede transport system auxiliary component